MLQSYGLAVFRKRTFARFWESQAIFGLLGQKRLWDVETNENDLVFCIIIFQILLFYINKILDP